LCAASSEGCICPHGTGELKNAALGADGHLCQMPALICKDGTPRRTSFPLLRICRESALAREDGMWKLRRMKRHWAGLDE